MHFNPENIFREKIGIGENRSVTYEDEDMRVEVDYKWKGKNKLEVIQNFAGGVRYYIFKRKKKWDQIDND